MAGSGIHPKWGRGEELGSVKSSKVEREQINQHSILIMRVKREGFEGRGSTGVGQKVRCSDVAAPHAARDSGAAAGRVPWLF